MKANMESNGKGGLSILDSMTQDEFKNLVEFFKTLLEIDTASIQKDVQGDSKPEVIPQMD